MFITGYEARRDRALTHGPLFYSLKLETVVTADEMHAIREILNGRSDVTLIETPSEAPVAGTHQEKVFGSGTTEAPKALTIADLIKATQALKDAPIPAFEPTPEGRALVRSLLGLPIVSVPINEASSAECPCGLVRADCEYHR